MRKKERMDVVEISSIEYAERLENVSYGYMKKEFCEYNKPKVEQVKYLLFFDEKKERFVASFGIKDGLLMAPFSAPFTIIGEISKSTELSHYREALEALKRYAEEQKCYKIRIVFPPFMYDEQRISYWVNAGILVGAKIVSLDLNYAINLKTVQEYGYNKMLTYNARKNLRIAYEKGNEFYVCEEERELEEAYEVIRKNREFKGYPLKMTYDQVRWTKDLLHGKGFLVKNEKRTLAAAIVFEPFPKVAQVIYWGDIPQVSEYKSVNFLAEQLVNYYSEKGFRVLDIGPSTENGEPNYGLCKFKESIGCNVSAKVTIEICNI